MAIIIDRIDALPYRKPKPKIVAMKAAKDRA
jgi:late competence protein required for DNA uptake (superfamily II DNA/RNA helicase)